MLLAWFFVFGSGKTPRPPNKMLTKANFPEENIERERI